MIGLKRGFLLIFIIVSDPQVRLWIISIVITDRIDRAFTKCSANRGMALDRTLHVRLVPKHKSYRIFVFNWLSRGQL